MSAHLLVMACSATKTDAEWAAAFDLYDGPTWRTLRAFERDNPAGLLGVDVLALSAEYGLIDAGVVVRNYDRRMTRDRAAELRTSTWHTLRAYAAGGAADVFVLAGTDYMPALELGLVELRGVGATVTVAAGGIGQKMAALKAWLVSATNEEV